jgi:hypothetical protein
MLGRAAKGPQSDQKLMLQMWLCYNDPLKVAHKARAQEHQQWVYNATVSNKLFLPGTLGESCNYDTQVQSIRSAV